MLISETITKLSDSELRGLMSELHQIRSSEAPALQPASGSLSKLFEAIKPIVDREEYPFMDVCNQLNTIFDIEAKERFLAAGKYLVRSISSSASEISEEPLTIKSAIQYLEDIRSGARVLMVLGKESETLPAGNYWLSGCAVEVIVSVLLNEERIVIVDIQ